MTAGLSLALPFRSRPGAQYLAPPGEPYLDPLISAARSPDPGPLPDTVTFVCRLSGPALSAPTGSIVNHGGPAEGDKSWYVQRHRLSTLFDYWATPSGNQAEGVLQSLAGPPVADVAQSVAFTVAFDRPGAVQYLASWVEDPPGVWTLVAETSADPQPLVERFDSPGQLAIGAPWRGRIYSVEANETSSPQSMGPVVWRFDAAEYPGSGTAWTDPRGRGWTITTEGAIHS